MSNGCGLAFCSSSLHLAAAMTECHDPESRRHTIHTSLFHRDRVSGGRQLAVVVHGRQMALNACVRKLIAGPSDNTSDGNLNRTLAAGL